VDLSGSGKEQVAGCCEYGNERPCSLKWGGLLDWGAVWVLKKDSAALTCYGVQEESEPVSKCSQSRRSGLHSTCCSPERTSGCPTDCAAAWAEFVVAYYHDNASSHLHLHLRFIHIRRPDVKRCCPESQTPLRSRVHLLIPVNAKCPSIPH